MRIENAVRLAAEMFIRDGIDNVKMTDIAERSGIGVATLYRHFNTKTGLLIAAMTYKWQELEKLFSGVFESEVFLAQSGIKQLRDLMRVFLVLFTAHADFMRLLAEFDVFIRTEKVSKEELADYDRSIINIYPYFEHAYKKGLDDGTVRETEDFHLFYTAHAHAVMELSKKLIQGELIPSDDFRNAEAEISILIDTAVAYLRKEQNHAGKEDRIQ